MPFSAVRKALHHLPLAAACMLAGAGLAQAQTDISLTGHEADSHVLPVWNARSGRIEALLLLSPNQNTPDLLDSTDPALPGVGLGISLNNGSRLRTSLQPESPSGLALLCHQGIHMALALGPLEQHCLLAQVSEQGDLLLHGSRGPGITLNTQWQSADGGLDMSFGLSWLNAPLHGVEPLSLPGMGARPAYTSQLPSLQPLVPGDISLREVHWNSRLALGSQQWLSLGGTLGKQELTALTGQPLRWDSATVTLGVGYRGLSGRLTGRLIELPQGQNFTALDLGVSWRTPWQGELSIGAKNLFNKNPDTSQWPLPNLPSSLEAPGGRTPYVRYKQDL